MISLSPFYGRQFLPKAAAVAHAAKPVFTGGVNPDDQSFLALRQKLVSIAEVHGPEIAYDAMKAVSHLAGWCNAIAYIVRKQFGGEIVRAGVQLEKNGQPVRETHYWNRVGNRDIDLASDQYGGDGLHAITSPDFPPKPVRMPGIDMEIKAIDRPQVVPPRKTVNRRFLKLERLLAALETTDS